MAADNDAEINERAVSGAELKPAMPAPRDLPAGAAASYRVCLVCLGNICRSPMAEVILRDEVGRAGLGAQVTVASAGTGDWHLGGPMDARAHKELARRGYDGSGHVARQISAAWVDDYDLFVVMDRKNLANLRRMFADGAARDRIAMMRSFDLAAPEGAEVPDPYHGGPKEYEETFDLVLAAARGLTRQLAARLNDAGMTPL
ncbi:MAG: low molecular weight protein-tyrosine-phosphatase [Streptosporangiaceae bacterium]